MKCQARIGLQTIARP